MANKIENERGQLLVRVTEPPAVQLELQPLGVPVPVYFRMSAAAARAIAALLIEAARKAEWAEEDARTS